jgi:O-antigen ligase
MQITQRIPKFSVVIISLILFWIACKAGIGIVDGKLKTIYIMTTLSALLMLPYVVGKIGTFPFFCALVFIYWIPFKTNFQYWLPSLGEICAPEFGMWMLCLGIVIHGSVSKSAQFNSAVGRFPFLPFALLIAGSLTANIISGNLFARDEFERIRILCLLPAVTCFVCLYFIKTVKQAECLLWIFLISAGLLGLVYLYAPQIAEPGILSSYGSLVEESGRIRRIIKLPLFGILYMSGETAPVCFAFLIALSFNLWLNHPSASGRLIAAVILAISALVIIRGQGRTALIAATCSVIAIQVLSLRFKSYSPMPFLRNPLKPAILIFTLLFSVWYFASVSEISGFRQHGLSLYANPLDAVVSSGRFDLWKTAFAVVLDNPLGVGIYGFPYGVYRASWAAHNLYLFLLLSFGIIGFIGYFWIFLRYTKACWSGLHSNSPNRRLLCIAGMGCVTTLFVAGFGSCIFGSFWAILMFWIPIGITMAVATLPEKVGGRRSEVRGRERKEDGRQRTVSRGHPG